jgi:transcriptional regulator with XRE-family HTH domain
LLFVCQTAISVRVMETDSPHARVARNVRLLRKRRGLTVRDLSAQLGQLGHPILPSVVSKIELGQRRVAVEDLLALALALDVSPNRLLFTETARPDRAVTLTGKVSRSEADVWRWAVGEDPLWIRRGVFDIDRQAEFPRMNRPHDPPDETTAAEVFERAGRGELRPVVEAFRQARKQGLSVGAILNYLKYTSDMEAFADMHPSDPGRDDDGEH